MSDGGIETTLIFLDGHELPRFAAFPLLTTREGEHLLRTHFRTYGEIARRFGVGLLLETAMWRASSGRGEKLSYDTQALADVNHRSVALVEEICDEYETDRAPVVISVISDTVRYGLVWQSGVSLTEGPNAAQPGDAGARKSTPGAMCINHRDRGQPTRPAATLPPPPRYFPVAADGYRMRPGLRALGTDFGAGALDGTLFQFHSDFPRYRENKLRCRRENYARYVGASRLPERVAEQVARFLADRLATEWPELFVREPLAGGGVRLACALTSEVLRFGPAMEWVGLEAGVSPEPPYRDAWDALACQIPEDLAVVCRAPDATDWLAAVHVCAPSDWAPEVKLGLEFAAVHRPVPGIAPLLRGSPALVDGMIRRRPTVRLVWSLAPDDRLNRHPHAPGVQRQIPRFAAQNTHSPPAYLRVERQGIWGFPAVEAALFTIGVTVTDLRAIREVPEQRARLAAAIRSMDAATRAYKGVGNGDELLDWLNRG